MSLFGSLMGGWDGEDDPLFGGAMRQINNMMNNHMNMMGSMFGPPPMLVGRRPNTELIPALGRNMMGGNDAFGMGLMPMGMFNPGIFGDMMSMQPNGNCHSFQQSTVMTMTSGPDGRPQVYQASSSTRQGPGGVKETRKSVADSRSGVKKLQIGHHIGERAHLVERERNYISGEAEERQEFINLDEDEADNFNHEWQTKTGGGRYAAITGGHSDRRQHYQPQLALPSSSTRTEQKKKRPHSSEPDSYQNMRKKTSKKSDIRISEPTPLIEEPDSGAEDEDEVRIISSKNSSWKSTVIEELE